MPGARHVHHRAPQTEHHYCSGGRLAPGYERFPHLRQPKKSRTGRGHRSCPQWPLHRMPCPRPRPTVHQHPPSRRHGLHTAVHIPSRRQALNSLFQRPHGGPSLLGQRPLQPRFCRVRHQCMQPTRGRGHGAPLRQGRCRYHPPRRPLEIGRDVPIPACPGPSSDS